MHRKYLLFIILTILANAIFAQPKGSLRCVIIKNENQQFVKDSLLIVPQSIHAFNSKNEKLTDSCIFFHSRTNSIEIRKNHYPITLYYRVFMYDFRASFPILSDSLPTLMANGQINKNEPYLVGTKSFNDVLFSTPGINKTGSITRGISMGNSQDVIVNSSLNLQMNGKLQDNLFIAAAISDNNIPIQPDGYSQQLREFDKVFIKIYNENQALQAGDIDIEKPEGYFMVLNRKVQGFNYQANFNINKQNNTRYKTQLCGASAKGKFSRNIIQGIEGNQGPYRLKGNSNETYIVILAGSEKIYIDGRKLTRGQDNDYVIDYNASELTFTTKQLITKDSRIVAEFEYTDKAYARYMVMQTNEIQTKHSNFWLNVFSENDSKNQPLDQALDNDAKKFLAELGDNTQQALYPRADSIAYNSNDILYEKRDTSINAKIFTYYLFSTNSNKAHYRLSFAYLGNNKGNYIKQLSLANGKVYRWVAPIDGIPQGDYEPLGLLVAPKKKQVFTIGGKTNLNPLTRIYSEIALSNNDLNTFSPLNDNNNVGYAYHVTAERDIRFSDSSWTANTKLSTQHTHKNFDALERFKSIEFERDWNINSSESSLTQIAETNISLSANIKKNNTYINRFQYDYLNRSNNYTASRISTDNKYADSLNRIDITGSYMSSDELINKTKFARFSGAYKRLFSYISIGYKNDMEKNAWNKTNSDSLLSSSYAFYRNEIYLQNNDSLQHSTRFSYSFRNDFQPINGKLLLATRANEYSTGIQLFKQKRHNIGFTLTYRKLNSALKNDTVNKNEGTLLSRIDYAVRSSDNFFTSSSYIEMGSGLENKRDYSYIEVAKGEGSYQWNDYNNNGLKELNEFEHAAFTDKASYIKVYIPTNQYVKVFNNGISHTSTLSPSRRWVDTTGWKSVLACFNNQFAVRAANKNSLSGIWKQINPLLPFDNTNELVSMNMQIRNELAYQSPSGIYGIEYQFLHNRLRNLLVNGLDNQLSTTHELRYHQQLSENYRLTTKSVLGNKEYQSGFLANRDYKLQSIDTEGGINWQNTSNSSFQLLMLFNNKNNKTGIERSTQYSVELNYDYSLSQKGNIRLSSNYIKIKFTGQSYSSVAYEMMQGLLPGNNYTWTAYYLKSLRNGLEIKINYNGRITGKDNPVHTAGVEIRANF